MERFKGISPHRPLGDSPTEIRIVNLLPGEYGGPIECVLEHIDMDITKDFEALSYCWGEASITKSILLDGRSYPVTTNLFDGVQRLRKLDEPRKLWIDSLCINQSNLTERSHEIQKMAEIYKHASQVVIWRGEYLPWSEAAVRSVVDYAVELSAEDGFNKLVARHGYTGLWNKQKRLNEFLRQHQWFERSWVLQEVAVRWPKWSFSSEKKPELLPVFCCGNIQMSYFCLRAATTTWLALPPERGSLKFLRFHPPATHHVMMCLGYDQQLRHGRKNMTEQLFTFLINGAAVFRATDPRDQIYAVLGLLEGGTLPAHLLPDYSKPIRQVLMEFGKYLLEENMTMNCLQFRSGKALDLPSWVPDWRHRPAHSLPLQQEKPNMIFCREKDEWHLQTDFLQFDFIEEAGFIAPLDSKQDDLVDCVEEILCSASAWLYKGTQKHTFTSAEDAKRFIKELILRYDFAMSGTSGSFWHQLILDSAIALPAGEMLVRQGKETSEDTLLSAAGTLNSLDIETAITELWRSVARNIKDKSIFICASGSVGIMEQADLQPQSGDVVGSIRGICCEMVLRPCLEEGLYKVVGQCHRSVQAMFVRMGDLNIEDWGNGMILREHLHHTFTKHPSRRITIC